MSTTMTGKRGPEAGGEQIGEIETYLRKNPGATKKVLSEDGREIELVLNDHGQLCYKDGNNTRIFHESVLDDPKKEKKVERVVNPGHPYDGLTTEQIISYERAAFAIACVLYGDNQKGPEVVEAVPIKPVFPEISGKFVDNVKGKTFEDYVDLYFKSIEEAIKNIYSEVLKGEEAPIIITVTGTVKAVRPVFGPLKERLEKKGYNVERLDNYLNTRIRVQVYVDKSFGKSTWEKYKRVAKLP